MQLVLWDKNKQVELADTYTLADLSMRALKSFGVIFCGWLQLPDMRMAILEGIKADLLLGCDVSEAYRVMGRRELGAFRNAHASGEDTTWFFQARRLWSTTKLPEDTEEQLNRLHDQEFCDVKGGHLSVLRGDPMPLEMEQTGK